MANDISAGVRICCHDLFLWVRSGCFASDGIPVPFKGVLAVAAAVAMPKALRPLERSPQCCEPTPQLLLPAMALQLVGCAQAHERPPAKKGLADIAVVTSKATGRS